MAIQMKRIIQIMEVQKTGGRIAMNTSPLSGLLHSGEFTNESAYFLGAILAANEVHRITPKGEKIWQ